MYLCLCSIALRDHRSGNDETLLCFIWFFHRMLKLRTCAFKADAVVVSISGVNGLWKTFELRTPSHVVCIASLVFELGATFSAHGLFFSTTHSYTFSGVSRILLRFIDNYTTPFCLCTLYELIFDHVWSALFVQRIIYGKQRLFDADSTLMSVRCELSSMRAQPVHYNGKNSGWAIWLDVTHKNGARSTCDVNIRGPQ